MKTAERDAVRNRGVLLDAFSGFALVMADFVETPLALYLKNKYNFGKATIGQGSDTWMEGVT